MKNTFFIIIAIAVSLQISSQNMDSVVIGNQVWAQKNLDVSIFNNGDTIPEAKTKDEWLKAGQDNKPAWCYFNNNSQNGKLYGKLYNWHAVMDPRGIAPKGWRVPSDKDWTDLINFLGGYLKTGDKLKSEQGWIESGSGSNGTGFSGLPGAARSGNGAFYEEDLGSIGQWWSTTESDPHFAWLFWLKYNNPDINKSSSIQSMGLSIRCIKN